MSSSNGLPPTLERVFPAPADLREEIARLARERLRDVRQAPPASPAALRWLEGCHTFLFAGALWIAEGGFLRRLSLPGGRPDGEWSLPEGSSVFASAGIVLGDYETTLLPGFAIDRHRMLWLARGYDESGTFLAVPIVFDARGREVWTPLGPTTRDDGFLRGTGHRALRTGSRPETFLLASEVDSGASASEFVMVGLAYELDPAAKRYAFVRDPVPTKALAETLVSVPVMLYVDGVEQVHFLRNEGVLALNGKQRLGGAEIEIAIPLPPEQHGMKTSVSNGLAGGAAGDAGIVVHDLASIPGARRILVWLPE